MKDKEIIEAEIIEESVITDEEAKAVFELEKKYLESYVKNKDKMELKEWLVTEMKQDLPERKAIEVEEMAVEIIESIKRNDENIESLKKAKERGMSNEQWLSGKIKGAVSAVGTNKMGEYLQQVESTIANANESLINEIMTKRGEISLNPNLDGFIAEQKLAHTFNINAALEGSKYRAEALTPEIYSKNSVDIVIKDEAGKIINRYQAKFGKTADETIQYIKNGNYNNQRPVVPAEQVEAVQKAFPNKSVTSCVGGTDKVLIKGREFEKGEVKNYQNEVQNGNVENIKYGWNDYSIKELTKSIGKKAGNNAMLAAGITTGVVMAEKIINGKEIDKDEVMEIALKSGADAGIKSALTGALKVGVEKGIISVIPKGTPIATIAAVATTAVENVKIMIKIANGELTVQKGIDKIKETTVAVTAGTILAGIATGAAITALGTLGIGIATIGGLTAGIVGLTAGIVGYTAGSEMGKKVVKVADEINNKVINTVAKAVETVKNVGSAIKSGLSNLCSGVTSWFR